MTDITITLDDDELARLRAGAHPQSKGVDLVWPKLRMAAGAAPEPDPIEVVPLRVGSRYRNTTGRPTIYTVTKVLGYNEGHGATLMFHQSTGGAEIGTYVEHIEDAIRAGAYEQIDPVEVASYFEKT